MSIFGENEEFEEKDNQCFLIMPFSEPWSDLVYKNVKKAVNDLGMECFRGDDAHGKIIVEDIWEKINESRIIITDVSKKNSNVFYELGISHALNKDVIIISQDEEDVPFDIKHFRRVIYENSDLGYKDLKEELSLTIKQILSKDLVDNFRSIIDKNDKVIVYVSAGGTCRCAMANAITRYYLKEISDENDISNIKSISAALIGPTHKYASTDAQNVIKDNLNMLMEEHKTLDANFDLLMRTDLILAMDLRMYNIIAFEYPNFKPKLYLFTDFLGSSGSIRDPYGGGYSEYLRCFNEINELLSKNMDKILEFNTKENSKR